MIFNIILRNVAIKGKVNRKKGDILAVVLQAYKIRIILKLSYNVENNLSHVNHVWTDNKRYTHVRTEERTDAPYVSKHSDGHMPRIPDASQPYSAWPLGLTTLLIQ